MYNHLNLSILPIINRLYCRLKSSGRNDMSIRSSHLMSALRNFLAMLSSTFSFTPDAIIDFSKSLRFILAFLPLSVSASSSLSSGITMAVERRS